VCRSRNPDIAVRHPLVLPPRGGSQGPILAVPTLERLESPLRSAPPLKSSRLPPPAKRHPRDVFAQNIAGLAEIGSCYGLRDPTVAGSRLYSGLASKSTAPAFFSFDESFFVLLLPFPSISPQRTDSPNCWTRSPFHTAFFFPPVPLQTRQ